MIAFCGNPLDRAGDKRGDADWLARTRASSNARVMLLWRLQPLLAGPEKAEAAEEIGFVDGARASAMGGVDAAEVFLGLDGNTSYFARDISELAEPPSGLGGREQGPDHRWRL